MNQGRIWCVVHPTVGLPLLLGSVALTSLAVHASVMSHTTWMSSYWQGSSKARTAESTNGNLPAVAAASPKADSAFVISIAPVAGTPGKTETSFVVTVAPNPAVAAASAEADPAASKTVAIAAAKPD